MLNQITIKNYKSIADLTLELGKFNVFIGENGCGKTNILEAVAMLAGAKNNRLEIQDLANMGVRVAKPSLTASNFLGDEQEKGITFEIISDLLKEFKRDEIVITPEKDDFYTTWNTNKNGYDTSKVAENEKLVELLNRVNKEGLQGDTGTNLGNEIIGSKSILEGLLGAVAFGIGMYHLDSINLAHYAIYNLNTQALRGQSKLSLKQPLGIHGEGLDLLLSTFSEEQIQQLEQYKYLISWLKDIVLDTKGELKYKSLQVEGNSSLYFRDKFMTEGTLFNVENANEGILHILFYLALFISEKTPSFFAIDNIETALNPLMCRKLTEILSTLNPEKQALITTHNPAILDGLDLTNDDIRLFAVSRNGEGKTICRRIQFKKGTEKKHKLSELWMQGLLGAVPKNF